MVQFSVTQPFYLVNRVLKPCHCTWKSAYCVYEFHYDIFKRESVHYVYLDVSLYMQLCRDDMLVYDCLSLEVTVGEVRLIIIVPLLLLIIKRIFF